MNENEPLYQAVMSKMDRGGALTPILQAMSIPWATFMDWVDRSPERGERLARARERWAELLVEDCPRIAADTEVDPKSRRVMVDTNLRVAALLAPRRYSQAALDRIVAPPVEEEAVSPEVIARRVMRAISVANRMAIAAPVEDADFVEV